MRIIVKLFSLAVVIVKSQNSQSRSHFSRSGYHRWCPVSSLNIPSHHTFSPFNPQCFPRPAPIHLSEGPPELHPFISQRSPSSGSSENLPSCPQILHAPFPMLILHDLHGGLVNVVPRPQAWRRFVPVLCITVSPRRLDQSLTFHGYLLNECDHDFTALLVGWWVL